MLALALIALWMPPVEGPVVRAFAGGPDPFARGLRRAVVLRAVPGEAVRAPCGGRVAFAGRTPRGPAVTLRCGERRATLLPVRVAVRHGERVRRGARLGAALGDVGLSVRTRDGVYLDPEKLLSAPLGPVRPPIRPRARPRPGPNLPARGAEPGRQVEPRAEPVWPVEPRAEPVRPAEPRVEPLRAPGPVRALPWPAWAGAALVLAAGAAGLRVRVARRPGAAARARAPARAA